VPVVIGVAIAAFTVFAVFAVIASHRRRRDLAGVAAQIGWRFDAYRRPPESRGMLAGPMFRNGHSRRPFNTMTGDLELAGVSVRAIMGDFAYTVDSKTGDSKSSRTETFSYLVFPCPMPNAPDLVIRHEHLGDRVLAAVGLDDIDFESAEFSRMFHVSSADKRTAYDIVHPRMMEFLLDGLPTRFTISDGVCCLSDGRATWRPAEFAERVAWCRRFFTLWPEHLREAHAGRSA
jgi:hypothetical protein